MTTQMLYLQPPSMETSLLSWSWPSVRLPSTGLVAPSYLQFLAQRKRSNHCAFTIPKRFGHEPVPIQDLKSLLFDSFCLIAFIV